MIAVQDVFDFLHLALLARIIMMVLMMMMMLPV